MIAERQPYRLAAAYARIPDQGVRRAGVVLGEKPSRGRWGGGGARGPRSHRLSREGVGSARGGQQTPPLPACGERWSMRLRRCGSLPAAGALRARLWPAEDRAEAPVDADLHGVDVREAGVEAEGA